MTDRHASRLRPHTPAVRAGALATGALLLALTGCTSGGSAEAAGDAEAGPGVIAPGRPGEDAATLSPEEAEAASRAQHQDPNEADISFMSMMIVHHAQALEMTGLAEKHAEDPRVQRLAARIAAAQQPEIAVMEAWLDEHTEPGHDHGHHGDHDGDHDHADMPGMAGPEQLAALAEARGTDFDRLFLELMSVHHEGAVIMSADVLGSGVERVVTELATEIAAQQATEIGRMQALLDSL